MKLLEGIETRKSCRAFTSIPIPKDILQEILKAATRSPSCMNTQPWEVSVVTGRKKNALSKILYDKASTGAIGNPDIIYSESWPAELFDH